MLTNTELPVKLSTRGGYLERSHSQADCAGLLNQYVRKRIQSSNLCRSVRKLSGMDEDTALKAAAG